MKHYFKSLALHVFLAAALTACGGSGSSSSMTASNGGDSSPSPMPDDLSNIAWAIDAASALQAVAGSEASTATPAQASQALAAIESNLDVSSVSDVLAYQGTGA